MYYPHLSNIWLCYFHMRLTHCDKNTIKSILPGRQTNHPQFWFDYHTERWNRHLKSCLSGLSRVSINTTWLFEIKKPIWQLLWFQLLIGSVFILLIGFILWYWQRNIKKREKRKREILEMENHVLQLEQKALQLQMNPHFIFNRSEELV